jgi:hypothetical protein
MALDEKDIAQITGIVKAATDTLAGTLGQAATRIEALTKDVETLKAAPADKGDSDKDAKKKPDGDKGADLAAAVQAAIKPLADQVAAMSAERSNADKAAKTAALIEATLKAKRPNMTDEQRRVVAGRIAAKSPGDETAVLAALGEVATELKALGADVKPMTTEPGAEGAAKPAGTAQEKGKQITEAFGRKPL